MDETKRAARLAEIDAMEARVMAATSKEDAIAGEMDRLLNERDDARAEVERIMALVDEHAAQEDVYGADACTRLADAIRARGGGAP